MTYNVFGATLSRNQSINQSLIVTYLLSCAVSKLWPIIGRIFAIDRGMPHFNTPAGGDPLRISAPPDIKTVICTAACC